jgi:hypothetical protein
MTSEGPSKIARERAGPTSLSKTYSRQNREESQIGKKNRSVLESARIEGAAEHSEALLGVFFRERSAFSKNSDKKVNSRIPDLENREEKFGREVAFDKVLLETIASSSTRVCTYRLKLVGRP